MFNNRFVCLLRLVWVQPWSIGPPQHPARGSGQQGWVSHPSSAAGASAQQQQVVPCELLLRSKSGGTRFCSLIDSGAYRLHNSLPRSCCSLNTANFLCCLHPWLPPNDHRKAFEGSVHCGAVGEGFVLGCEGILSSGWPLPWVAERCSYKGRKGSFG